MASDLQTVRSVLAGLDAQAKTLMANIEANRRAREELAAQPLPLSDVLAIWEAACDHWSTQTPALLARAVDMIRTRPGKSAAQWAGQTPLLPGHALELANILPGLIPAELKVGLASAIGGMQEHPDAGPPWSEREATLAAYDAAIDQDEAALAALKAEVAAAGVSWAGAGLYR